ncbi:DUF4276 family protein [Labrys miyagiensis]
MTVEHFEILVEEPSMEVFLRSLLTRFLSGRASFEIYPYQGKHDLLSRLEERLRGYATWLPHNWRILVIVDRDDDDCLALKQDLESAAVTARLSTRTSNRQDWRVVSRIAIEELEAWYFGDWEAVRLAYPRVGTNVTKKASYRLCDEISGGTWEAFERELQHAGYFSGGLRKIEAARNISDGFDVARCSSPSFRCLIDAMDDALN